MNVRQAVPFLRVADIEHSVRFYVGGLGFEMTKSWTPDGALRWCWLQKGGASMMLQQFARDGHGGMRPAGALGLGVSFCFICEDALAIYRDAIGRSIEASEPFVSNGMWYFSVTDPDGYVVEFESETDVPEETRLSEASASR